MGLPPADRFPCVAVAREPEGLRLSFTGAGETRVVDVPAWTLAGEDLEGAELALLARLQGLGFEARRDES